MSGIRFSKVKKTSPDTVIVVCSGKSVEKFNFNTIPDTAVIIAVNGSAQFLPRVDYWFTLDPWGLNGPQLPKNHKCEMWAAVPDDYSTTSAKSPEHRKTPDPRVKFLHRLASHNVPGVSSETAYTLEMSEDTGCISTGNSGYGALNLAYHLRPKNIIILGMDGDIGYFYSKSEKNRPLTHLPKMIDSTVQQFKDAGIRVINGSPNSSIKSFPRMSAEQAMLEVFGSDYTDKFNSINKNYQSITEKPAVVCVLRRSPVYTAEYVNNLYKMIKDNTTIDFDFFCYTDDASDLHKDINIIKLKHDYPGWWSKIEMFNPEFLNNRNIIFFDLDTVIYENIDHILKREYRFCGLRDFYHNDRFASGIMAWKQTGKYRIYERFVLTSAAVMRNAKHGDQEYISDCIKNDTEFFQDLFPKQVVSYKAHCLRGGTETVPEQCKIICFHGKPKPKDLKINSLIRRKWEEHGDD